MRIAPGFIRVDNDFPKRSFECAEAHFQKNHKQIFKINHLFILIAKDKNNIDICRAIREFGNQSEAVPATVDADTVSA